jgi:hypothetical protein
MLRSLLAAQCGMVVTEPTPPAPSSQCRAAPHHTLPTRGASRSGTVMPLDDQSGTAAMCHLHCMHELVAQMAVNSQDVEVAPGNPNQFWSASEDGSIREYDKRCTCAFST